MLLRSLGLVLTLLFACRPASEPVPAAASPAPATPPSAKTHTYLALGDSYTIGTSVSGAERWSVQLANRLREKGVRMQAPDLVAQAGWTTADLLRALGQVTTEPRYDLVSLLIGVNNQYQGKSVEAYRAEFSTLLKTATDKAGGDPGRVFVLSIPDWGVTPFAAGQNRAQIGREIDQFNAEARAVCTQQGVLFIDVTPLSRTAATDALLVASDGLHFSGKMYALWAETATGPVQKLLAQP